MKYRKLGTADLERKCDLPRNYDLGRVKTLEEKLFEQMDCALDRGVNFFDTARDLFGHAKKRDLRQNRKRVWSEWFSKSTKKKKRNNLSIKNCIKSTGLEVDT